MLFDELLVKKLCNFNYAILFIAKETRREKERKKAAKSSKSISSDKGKLQYCKPLQNGTYTD